VRFGGSSGLRFRRAARATFGSRHGAEHEAG